ncbi:hypothetical protein EST38_g13159 [Candolleomyces aberdarensis]|uniref:Uncharacterized protein n=1 Tax=Candolleomyces aberdarensis TaxID=2316362 RepID=A0A4Q2D2R0_9AGAR|nr:hypothetical protein EST38_g13159 [Candolleomyces aberdarensis]
MQQIIECPLDFDSLPAKWEELPLPVLYRRSLKAAVGDLPFIIGHLGATDEVLAFTQNGGWQKINNLLPLLYRLVGWLFREFKVWIRRLGDFTKLLKYKKLDEFAAAISEFVEKWERDETEWRNA